MRQSVNDDCKFEGGAGVTDVAVVRRPLASHGIRSLNNWPSLFPPPSPLLARRPRSTRPPPPPLLPVSLCRPPFLVSFLYFHWPFLLWLGCFSGASLYGGISMGGDEGKGGGEGRRRERKQEAKPRESIEFVDSCQ